MDVRVEEDTKVSRKHTVCSRGSVYCRRDTKQFVCRYGYWQQRFPGHIVNLYGVVYTFKNEAVANRYPRRRWLHAELIAPIGQSLLRMGQSVKANRGRSAYYVEDCWHGSPCSQPMERTA